MVFRSRNITEVQLVNAKRNYINRNTSGIEEGKVIGTGIQIVLGEIEGIAKHDTVEIKRIKLINSGTGVSEFYVPVSRGRTSEV